MDIRIVSCENGYIFSIEEDSDYNKEEYVAENVSNLTKLVKEAAESHEESRKLEQQIKGAK